MKHIKIAQCYFCPHWICGNSTGFQDVGFCIKEKKSLTGTMIETDTKDEWTQTIPDWCGLEDCPGDKPK